MLLESIEHHSVSRGFSHIPRRVVKMSLAFEAANWYPSQVRPERKDAGVENERLTDDSEHIFRLEGTPTEDGTLSWVRKTIVFAA